MDFYNHILFQIDNYYEFRICFLLNLMILSSSCYILNQKVNITAGTLQHKYKGYVL